VKNRTPNLLPRGKQAADDRVRAATGLRTGGVGGKYPRQRAHSQPGKIEIAKTGFNQRFPKLFAFEAALLGPIALE
jgi:hypothetical protein